MQVFLAIAPDSKHYCFHSVTDTLKQVATTNTISPWAIGRHFTYRYHLWWQRLLVIFRIHHVSAIYFDMIAISGWQLKIVMSSFMHTPNETQSD